MSSAGNWGAPSWHSLAQQYNVPQTQQQLYQGLAKTAVDPTAAPTSTNPTSMARATVPGATAAQMGDASGALTTNNTTPAAATAPSSGTLAQSVIAAPQVRSLAATTPAPAATVAAKTAAPLPIAVNANQGAAAAASSAAAGVKYNGPQAVATPSLNGYYNYYVYDSVKGGYRYVGQYNPTKQQYNGYFGFENGKVTAADGSVIDTSGWTQQQWDAFNKQQNAVRPGYVNYKGPTGPGNTIDQIGNVTYLGQLPGTGQSGNAITGSRDGSSAVDANYSKDLSGYQDQLAAAKTADAAKADAAAVAQALAYMENNQGQAPTGTALTPAQIAQAQTAYQTEMAGSQIAGSLAMAPISTAATDATNAQTLAAQYSANSNLFGGSDAVYSNRLAGLVNQAQVGQNANQTQTAAAASFNTNLTAFANAVAQQAQQDTSATGAKLNADMNQISDYINTIAQNAGQLSIAAQQQVATQVSALQSLLNQYNQDVAKHGVNSSFAMGIATDIFKGASGLSAAAV